MFHVKQKSYDIVVVGAGHAVEAATMASRLGLKVAIVTFNSSDFELFPATQPWVG